MRKGFGVEWEAMRDAVVKGIGDLPGSFVEWLRNPGDKVDRVMGETVGERIGSSVECEIGLMEDEKFTGGIGEGWA